MSRPRHRALSGSLALFLYSKPAYPFASAFAFAHALFRPIPVSPRTQHTAAMSQVIDPTKAGKYPVVLSDALLGGPAQNVFTNIRCMPSPFPYIPRLPLRLTMSARQPQARALLRDEPRAGPPKTCPPGLHCLIRALLPGWRRQVCLRRHPDCRRQSIHPLLRPLAQGLRPRPRRLHLQHEHHPHARDLRPGDPASALRAVEP